ncbi:hypothetical protein ZWY2020_041493 [Hordeum vulgare]|nr:hypothetical protein ZWY2020_041493 [Hordeum vulgare]
MGCNKQRAVCSELETSKRPISKIDADIDEEWEVCVELKIVPKASSQVQVEAKEVLLSDMPTIMIDDTDVQTISSPLNLDILVSTHPPFTLLVCNRF